MTPEELEKLRADLSSVAADLTRAHWTVQQIIDQLYVPPPTQTVRTGAELAAALASAEPGITIQLAPDTVYEGDFILPANGGGLIEGVQTSLLRGRMRTAARAHDWTLSGFSLEGTAGFSTLISLGTDKQTADEEPASFLLEGLALRGNGATRGIALNCRHGHIKGCQITEIVSATVHAQAVCGWNGHGPYIIEDSVLEASGENILFGGADPSIPDLVPSDILVRRCAIRKLLEWRGVYRCYNLFELKNARRVTLQDTVMGTCWAGHNFAIVLKTENQSGTAPWSQVEDVLIERVTVQGAPGGVNVRGIDPKGGLPALNVTLRDCRLEDIDKVKYGGYGAFVLAQAGFEGLRIENTYARQSGMILMHDGVPCPGLVMTGNDLARGTYGIGAGLNEGTRSLNANFPGWTFEHNTVYGVNAAIYPAGNTYP